MKSKLLICCIATLLAFPVAQAKRVKVTLKEAGTLSQMISEKDKGKITELSIAGTLNTNDFQFLYDICNSVVDGEVTDNKLHTLDLSNANFDASNTELLRKMLWNAKSLRHIIFGDVDKVYGHSFTQMPNLETVEFRGNVGHIDGYMFNSLPKLRAITFEKAVISTGGSQFVYDCPALEQVVFNGPVFCLGFGEAIECPNFKGYVVNAPILESSNPNVIAVTDSTTNCAYKGWAEAYDFMEKWAVRITENDEFFKALVPERVQVAVVAAPEIGMDEVAARLSDLFPTEYKLQSYLDILKEAADYERTGQTEPAFTYAEPTDSILTRTREYFNLDSITGNGDDISRIMNLLYWMHDLLPHNGSVAWPECDYNAVDIYEFCKKNDRGVNCLFLALMLNEALLAEGIPARYVSCQPRDYDKDSDSHVICAAWSRSLNKWIWVDPTFCAYVKDENGVLLHPGEVRERLRDGRPLVLNEDANWNHQEKQTKEYYLEEYMAKNLYVMQVSAHSGSNSMSRNGNTNSAIVALAPKGFKFRHATTTDDEYFWQAPPKELVK